MPVVTGIKSESLPQYWPLIRPALEKAVEEHGQGEFLVDDIFVGAMHNITQLWVLSMDGKSPTAYAITRVVDYPRKRVCRIVLLTGSGFDEWNEPFMNFVRPWAKANGCVEFEFSGRKGWTRKLKDLGWREVSVNMALEI